ncbi:hypothetical protein [Nocardiopsis synnemataformans]|uniref:hypothetical protein n=1 Tax=Nocardiopsis synnemataformans TaxID=61305 RepID=UPI003EBBEFD7
MTEALDARAALAAGADGVNVWVPLTGAPEAAVVADLAGHGWAVRPGSLSPLTHRPAVRVTTSALLPEHAEAFAARLTTAPAPNTKERPCSPA